MIHFANQTIVVAEKPSSPKDLSPTVQADVPRVYIAVFAKSAVVNKARLILWIDHEECDLNVVHALVHRRATQQWITG